LKEKERVERDQYFATLEEELKVLNKKTSKGPRRFKKK